MPGVLTGLWAARGVSGWSMGQWQKSQPQAQRCSWGPLASHLSPAPACCPQPGPGSEGSPPSLSPASESPPSRPRKGCCSQQAAPAKAEHGFELFLYLPCNDAGEGVKPCCADAVRLHFPSLCSSFKGHLHVHPHTQTHGSQGLGDPWWAPQLARLREFRSGKWDLGNPSSQQRTSWSPKHSGA